MKKYRENKGVDVRLEIMKSDIQSKKNAITSLAVIQHLGNLSETRPG